MAKVGYARVSSSGQSLDIQLQKLQQAGCERIYQEKMSGSNSIRPQFKACMDYLREGDSLVITRLDRLARSVMDLANILGRFEVEHINLEVIDQNIDTSTPSGKLLFNMLASIAEFENDLRRERQQEGIANAKQRKVKFGRKPKLTSEIEAKIIEDKFTHGLPMSELANRYKLSQATLYRVLATYKSNVEYRDINDEQ